MLPQNTTQATTYPNLIPTNSISDINGYLNKNIALTQPVDMYTIKSNDTVPSLYDDTMYAIKNMNNHQIDPELLKHYHDINPKLATYNLEQHFYQGDRNVSLQIDKEILHLYTQINPKLQLLPDIMVYCI
jgi:hypothetical protein